MCAGLALRLCFLCLWDELREYVLCLGLALRGCECLGLIEKGCVFMFRAFIKGCECVGLCWV